MTLVARALVGAIVLVAAAVVVAPSAGAKSVLCSAGVLVGDGYFVACCESSTDPNPCGNCGTSPECGYDCDVAQVLVAGDRLVCVWHTLDGVALASAL